MMPDWPSLWERESGLRPDALGDVGRWEELPKTAPSLFAALCRDAAVRWLMDQGWYIHLHRPGRRANPTEQVMVRFINADGSTTSHTGLTLDAALFAACAAVLDARER